MKESLKKHYPEYLIEAFGTGVFVFSICFFVVLLRHPESIAADYLNQPNSWMIFMGLAMAGTVISLVYSPWGKRSGAHFNPSVTLTFFRLKKIKKPDFIFYVLFQFLGGLIGMGVALSFLGRFLSHSSVNYVATLPGSFGMGGAISVEFFISFLTMFTVLGSTNYKKTEKMTGLFVAILVFHYVFLAVPISGFGMNPARTFPSSLVSMEWTGWWIYFFVPPLGMLLASQVYLWIFGAKKIQCAKLHHANLERCIFCQKEASLSK